MVHSVFIHLYYNKHFKKEANRTCKTKILAVNQKAASIWRSVWSLSSGTCLCFLCCRLFVSTLGVTCVDQLGSVLGHQFDQTWERAARNKHGRHIRGNPCEKITNIQGDIDSKFIFTFTLPQTVTDLSTL